MSFTTKFGKVRFVTLGKGGRESVGFCYSLCHGFLKRTMWLSLRGGGAGTLAPQALVLFLLLTLPRVCDVFDIHRCRSTLHGTGQPSSTEPSPGYIAVSSATRKDPQTLN